MMHRGEVGDCIGQGLVGRAGGVAREKAKIFEFKGSA